MNRASLHLHDALFLSSLSVSSYDNPLSYLRPSFSRSFLMSLQTQFKYSIWGSSWNSNCSILNTCPIHLRLLYYIVTYIYIFYLFLSEHPHIYFPIFCCSRPRSYITLYILEFSEKVHHRMLSSGVLRILLMGWGKLYNQTF